MFDQSFSSVVVHHSQQWAVFRAANNNFDDHLSDVEYKYYLVQ